MDTRTATAAAAGALAGAAVTVAGLWATLYRGQARAEQHLHATGGAILGPTEDDPDRAPAWLSRGGPIAIPDEVERAAGGPVDYRDDVAMRCLVCGRVPGDDPAVYFEHPGLCHPCSRP